MPLAQAVRDMKVAAARSAANRSVAKAQLIVSMLRDLRAEHESACRQQGFEPETGAAMAAFIRSGFDSIQHAADLGGAATLTPEDLAQAEEASHRG